MDLSKINALCLGGGTSNISYKEMNKIQVGWCSSTSCYLGDNMHTLITPTLALLERELKQWSVIQTDAFIRPIAATRPTAQDCSIFSFLINLSHIINWYFNKIELLKCFGFV